MTSLRYKDWFKKAAHDLRGAEILMEHDGGNDLVAFHCQQAMEKMLKGWLLKTTGLHGGRIGPHGRRDLLYGAVFVVVEIHRGPVFGRQAHHVLVELTLLRRR